MISSWLKAFSFLIKKYLSSWYFFLCFIFTRWKLRFILFFRDWFTCFWSYLRFRSLLTIMYVKSFRSMMEKVLLFLWAGDWSCRNRRTFSLSLPTRWNVRILFLDECQLARWFWGVLVITVMILLSRRVNFQLTLF